MNEQERLSFWETTAKRNRDEVLYYQEELVKAHALIGRIIHQLSERWDTVNITKYFPTDNPIRKRTGMNPSGKSEEEEAKDDE